MSGTDANPILSKLSGGQDQSELPYADGIGGKVKRPSPSHNRELSSQMRRPVLLMAEERRVGSASFARLLCRGDSFHRDAPVEEMPLWKESLLHSSLTELALPMRCSSAISVLSRAWWYSLMPCSSSSSSSTQHELDSSLLINGESSGQHSLS